MPRQYTMGGRTTSTPTPGGPLPPRLKTVRENLDFLLSPPFELR